MTTTQLLKRAERRAFVRYRKGKRMTYAEAREFKRGFRIGYRIDFIKRALEG